MSFVGGKLKLKGGEPLKASGGTKKKKKKSSPGPDGEALALALKEEDKAGSSPTGDAVPGGSSSKAEELKKVLHGYELPSPTENEDRRTEAERRKEEKLRKLEEDRLRKLAAKSHREKVKEFNDYLTNLSEHHDIPKVGPG